MSNNEHMVMVLMKQGKIMRHTIDSIKTIITPIAKKYGLKRVYLFGSYAKGSATDDSDIDLLIEKGRPLSLITLSSLRQDTEDALELPVDLLTTTGVEKSFKDAISGTEILVYEE